MRLTKAARAEWSAALRSGEFVQARGALARDLGDGKIGYCCLGVKCKLDDKDLCVAGETENEIVAWEQERRSLRATNAPVPEFNHYSDLREDLSEEINHLIEMNDTDCSFSQIADAVDQLPTVD